MKNLISLLLVNIAFISAMADEVPGISVEYINKGTSAYAIALAQIGRIELNNGNVAIVYDDGSVENLGETVEIDKISFTMVEPTDIGNALSTNDIVKDQNASVSVYPNPVSDILTIKGMSEGQIARLFDQEGRLIYSDTNNTINVKDLSSGIYLLKVGSDVFKIFKK